MSWHENGILQLRVDAPRELQHIYEGGATFSLRLLPDGTFEVRYGDYLRNSEFHGSAGSFEEAVTILMEAVKSHRHYSGLVSQLTALSPSVSLRFHQD